MQHDLKQERRRLVIAAMVVVTILIYIVRLFNLQILDTEYKQKAIENALLNRTLYPSRGIIYDRNGRELVYNQPAYDLLVTMNDVKHLDTLDFCRTLDITKEQFIQRIKEIKDRRRNPGYSKYTPQTFATQLSGQDCARVQEALYRFEGFETRKRTIRQYRYPIAPHILGNIREVSAKEIERDPYYTRGDFTGDLGVERSYEKYLRGEKGHQILYRNPQGIIMGAYEGGKHDKAPVAGCDIHITIDAELQQYAESLMNNKVGALVAIEPATGQILAMVSSPTFDPRQLAGRQRGKNYLALSKNPYRPLFDRAISASYPPGSTFKPTQGLIALQDGAITPETQLPCHGGFVMGNFRMGCHDGNASWSIVPAVATSCNGYFGWCLVRILENKKYKSVQEAFDHWKDYMVSMGYGYKLGIDIPGETRGLIPNTKYYNKAFATDKWKPLNIISISIGQGEILATPLQIANLAATIANRGYYYIPHVIKDIQGYEQIPDTFLQRHYTLVEKKNYDIIAEGMRQAAIIGTVRRMGNLDPEGIALCGKTGTAQNPHGRDHSVFMGFAPKDDPKIAVCCFVENGGFGATFGVPIGSLVIEKYLNDSISPRRKYIEEHMLETSTMMYMDSYKK